MKKAISIILAMVMLVLIFALPAYAQDSETNLYFDKFLEFINEEENYRQITNDEVNYYREVYSELYCHQNEQGDVEWVLIKCQIYPLPWEAVFGVRVGNRVFKYIGGSSDDDTGHYVYISTTDTIIPLNKKNLDSVLELCPDILWALEENNVGQQFGDVDNDGELSVMDATYIQRDVADIYDYLMTHNHINPFSEDSFDVADINHDGETSVLDATFIQKKLAQIEE